MCAGIRKFRYSECLDIQKHCIKRKMSISLLLSYSAHWMCYWVALATSVYKDSHSWKIYSDRKCQNTPRSFNWLNLSCVTILKLMLIFWKKFSVPLESLAIGFTTLPMPMARTDMAPKFTSDFIYHTIKHRATLTTRLNIQVKYCCFLLVHLMVTSLLIV